MIIMLIIIITIITIGRRKIIRTRVRIMRIIRIIILKVITRMQVIIKSKYVYHVAQIKIRTNKIMVITTIEKTKL